MSIGTRTWDGPVAHILANGSLVRTVACPVPNRPSTGCAEHAPEPPDRPCCPARSPSHDGSVSAAP